MGSILVGLPRGQEWRWGRGRAGLGGLQTSGFCLPPLSCLSAHTGEKSLLTEHHRIIHVHEKLGIRISAYDPSSREVGVANHRVKAVRAIEQDPASK